MSGRICDYRWRKRLEIAKSIVPAKENMTGRSYYYRLANMTRVADIMEPLGPDLRLGESTEQAQTKLFDDAIKYDPHSRVSLVYGNKKVIGHTTMDHLTSAKTIGEDGTIVGLNPIVEDTKVFYFLWKADIIDFSHQLVLSKTGYIGSVNINSFSKLPFRLCLLALTLEFEDNILRLIMGHPENAWNMVPDRNKGEAKKIYRKQYGRPSDSQSTPMLLGCLLFSTKCNILKGIEEGSNMKIPLDLDLLKLVVNIRNNCAHSAPDDAFLQILNHRALWEFTVKFQGLNHTMGKFRWDGKNLYMR